MKLHLFAVLAEFIDFKLGALFGGELHINLIPLCNVVLTFTDGTN